MMVNQQNMMGNCDTVSDNAACNLAANGFTGNGIKYSNQMSCKEMFDWVAMLGFCAYDMLLYMDTHPDDSNALDYFNQCTELYNAAKKAYEERFNQLDAFSGGPLTRWDWNEAPMPWEGGK